MPSSVVTCTHTVDLTTLMASCGPGLTTGRRTVGETLAHDLHAVGVAGVHERLQDRHVLCRGLFHFGR
jgi:hypothetical protein